MPGRNGTGPMGTGMMTGRGFGFCARAEGFAKDAGLGLGLGMACRRGFGRGLQRFFNDEEMTANNRKELLQSQKNVLKSQLAVIDKQLENL